MEQFLTIVQQWLGNLPGDPPSTPNAGEAETESKAPPISGFEEGLEKADVLVETGLPPEKYVRRGLASHGGRLRQQEVCALTGWSEASVSRTLTEMEEAGQITRIRVGRENIVCLPHAVPGRASPAYSRGETD